MHLRIKETLLKDFILMTLTCIHIWNGKFVFHSISSMLYSVVPYVMSYCIKSNSSHVISLLGLPLLPTSTYMQSYMDDYYKNLLKCMYMGHIYCISNKRDNDNNYNNNNSKEI